MISQPRGRVTLVTAVLISLTVLIAGAVPTLAHEEHGHPARIHEGACEALGPVAYRLNGVGGSVDQDNAPIATPTTVNPDSAYQIMVSETTIDGTIDEILAGGHAVMVYESDEAMDGIACGNAGGAMTGDTLITALGETGVPGHVGFALFQPEGDQTVVTVILGHGLSPISASGAGDTHDPAMKEEEAGHAVATPEA